MRRFRVWLDKNVCGSEPIEEILEFNDNATDEECRRACADWLDDMIANELDTGWNEIDPKPKVKKEPT